MSKRVEAILKAVELEGSSMDLPEYKEFLEEVIEECESKLTAVREDLRDR